MAVRIVQYIIFTCFLCITCQKVDLNRRFIRQLDIFKREVRDELSFITGDIYTLFETCVCINRTLQNNVNVNKGRPDENKQARVDMGKYNERHVDKTASSGGLSEKYNVLKKAFESEKQLNRKLQDRLKSFESELKSVESEKQLIRQLQSRIQGLESEKKLNHELQNRVKAFEDSISGIYSDVVANMTLFINHVNETLEDSLKHIAEKQSNSLEIDYYGEDNVNMQTTTQRPPKSCDATSESGVVSVFIGAVKSLYCDAETDGGGWTVIMRRQDGSVDFNKSWKQYKNGFGNVDGEFWVGNDVIHALTKSKPRELRIDMHDFDGNKVYAKYDTFEIESETDKYRLQFAGYSGTAGDGLKGSGSKYTFHNGMKFSTFDSDNDRGNNENCASYYSGGWWFNRCFSAHLTGKYSHVSKIRHYHGIIWYPWTDWKKGLKFVEMKIR